jgi:hypothetical protein
MIQSRILAPVSASRATSSTSSASSSCLMRPASPYTLPFSSLGHVMAAEAGERERVRTHDGAPCYINDQGETLRALPAPWEPPCRINAERYFSYLTRPA